MELIEKSPEVIYIEEPELSFGHGQTCDHPKDGLFLSRTVPRRARERFRLELLERRTDFPIFAIGPSLSAASWQSRRVRKPTKRTACTSPIFPDWRKPSGSRSTPATLSSAGSM